MILNQKFVARCLSCNKEYLPDSKLPACEYPYCAYCNLKTSFSLTNLRDTSIDRFDKSYRTRPGKRQGQRRAQERSYLDSLDFHSNCEPTNN